jgi:hypothetical protein
MRQWPRLEREGREMEMVAEAEEGWREEQELEWWQQQEDLPRHGNH